MTGLANIMRQIFGKFGRPDYPFIQDSKTDAALDGLDHRLTDVERKSRENDMRLRIIERASNPWGIGRDP